MGSYNFNVVLGWVTISWTCSYKQGKEDTRLQQGCLSFLCPERKRSQEAHDLTSERKSQPEAEEYVARLV